MSDYPRASAFNDASRYPYYNGGKTVNNAREREFPIKVEAPNLGKRRGRGEGGVGETRRERGKLRFPPLPKGFPRFPCENTTQKINN